MVLHDLLTLIRTPIRAHPPMSVPTTRARVTQLIRRGSISLGTSTPTAAAPCSRRPTRRAFLPRRVRDATGSRAARCRNGRAPTMTSAGADRTAAATARSGPATTAAAARTAAASRSSWSTEATVEAVRKSTMPAASSSSTTIVSVERAPWAMRADRRMRSWSKMLSRAASAIEGLGVPGGPVAAGVGVAVGVAPVRAPCRRPRRWRRLARPVPSGLGRRASVPAGRPAAGRSGAKDESGSPGRRPGHEERVVGRSGRAGGQHRRHPGPGPVGHQGQIGLVLDLLAPGQGQGRAGVPVEEETDRLGQQLGVGCVTPVHRDVDRAAVDASRRIGPTPHSWFGRRHHVDRDDLEVAQQQLHLAGRREPEGRTEDQVDDGGHAPAPRPGWPAPTAAAPEPLTTAVTASSPMAVSRHSCSQRLK